MRAGSPAASRCLGRGSTVSQFLKAGDAVLHVGKSRELSRPPVCVRRLAIRQILDELRPLIEFGYFGLDLYGIQNIGAFAEASRGNSSSKVHQHHLILALLDQPADEQVLIF